MRPTLLLCTLVLAGCGTTGNLFQDRPAYFGGVSKDFEAYHEYTTVDDASLGGDVMWSSFLLLDVPLSVVGDAVTLPYVWLRSFNTGPATGYP